MRYIFIICALLRGCVYLITFNSAKYFGRFRKPFKMCLWCPGGVFGWKPGNLLNDESFRENSLWESDMESLHVLLKNSFSGMQDHRRMFTRSHECMAVSGGNISLPAHNMPFLLWRISDNIQSNLLQLTSRCLQRFPRLKLIQMNVLRVHRSKPERKIREFQTVSVEQDGEVFSVVRVDVKQQRRRLARPEA